MLEQEPSADGENLSWIELEYRRELFRCAAERVQVEFEAETWQAFWQTTIEGREISEVARLQGKTSGAVRIARCRVLARLKQKVSELDVE